MPVDGNLKNRERERRWERRIDENLLTSCRFAGLLVFAIGVLLLLSALANVLLGFSEHDWLRAKYIRTYLFLAVMGILFCILITFRKRNE